MEKRSKLNVGGRALYSCQIGEDRLVLFAYNVQSLRCIMVQLNSNLGTFRTHELAKPKIHRDHSTIVNVDDSQIFMIGGVDTSGHQYSSVSLYKIAENNWTENLPELNEARGCASGCYVGRAIFVFGGFNWTTIFNTIEKLSLANLASGEAQWQLIEPSLKEFPALTNPCLTALNREEIAILGGKNTPEDFSNGIYIFNTKTEKFTPIANENPMRFATLGNTTVRTAPDTLISYVSSEQIVPYLIEFRKGWKTVKVLTEVKK